MYYDFLIGRWQRGQIAKERLQKFVPYFITQEEYEQIVSTPQD